MQQRSIIRNLHDRSEETVARRTWLGCGHGELIACLEGGWVGVVRLTGGDGQIPAMHDDLIGGDPGRDRGR
jgi:hypothetical protein